MPDKRSRAKNGGLFLKKRMAVLAVLILVCLCAGASGGADSYPDGVYRGFYYSEGVEQVAVQFELKDGLFKSVVLRSLNNRWGNLLIEGASTRQKERLSHFVALADYLEGKGVEAVNDLYDPAPILEAAGLTPSEHVPYAKLISALWDGLNRRPYKLVDTSKLPEAAPYADGIYTGAYGDDEGEQVVLQFTVADNCITGIEYIKLDYMGVNYLEPHAPEEIALTAGQFQELIDYLVGKPIGHVNDLYRPEMIASDTDVSSAATLRAPKIISAIWDGLNKNAYIVD